MTILKRFCVLWAVLVQDWVEDSCCSCKRPYWTQASVRRPGANECPECETRVFAKWLNEMENRFDKGAA